MNQKDKERNHIENNVLESGDGGRENQQQSENGKMRKKKRRHVYSIKTLMIALMLACWLIPFILITGATAYYVLSHHFDNKISNLLTQIEFHNELISERLNNVITEAKMVSYEGEINGLYAQVLDGSIGMRTLLRSGNKYLSQKYNTQDAMEFAVIWYKKDPDAYYSSMVNKSIGGNFQMVSDYWAEDHDRVYELSESLDTSIGFYSSGDRIYLFRNLLDNAYRHIGTMVIRLNTDYCFGHLKTIGEDANVMVKINDTLIPITGDEIQREEMVSSLEDGASGTGYFWEKSKLYIHNQKNNGTYRLTAFVKFENSDIYMPLYGYRFILAGMLVLLIPLFLVVLWTFRRRIHEPVEAMMYGSAQIEKGRFGFQLSENMYTKEFQYLQSSFNQMSERLKYQFDHIYQEELALRDARIMALQSHINPHFMNNTLEIINWEARMAGADKVSEMISALGTLMDATIDRKKRPEVPLSEEMKYVNAYFYITSERLGDRLVIYNEIPESVMKYQVPRLILQPVIENAIEHGVVRRGKGTVTLTGKKEGDYLYLDIINDALLEEFDAQKIERLLAPDYDTSKEPSGNMGIANVNQRLRILYGEPCGLTIRRTDDMHITARLTILVQRTETD